MGIGPKFSGGSVRAPGNPDPHDWVVQRHLQIGRYLILQVRYPGVTNFEGEKILLLENSTFVEVTLKSDLDPHFTRDSKLIARFIPTPRGWRMAMRVAQTLDDALALITEEF